jgi:Flp pilus assembly protein TadD
MIVCPACHAENPDGTKICVKCATELPKAVVAGAKAKAALVASAPKEFGVRDIGKDMVDFLWLILIFLLILIGFLGQVTGWTFRFTEMEEAKIVSEPVPVERPAPVRGKKHKPIPGRPLAKKPAKVITRQPTGSAETLFLRGKKQYDTNKYLASYNSLRQSLEVDPTYAKAYFGLGYLYSRFDMNDAAVRMYEMALRFDPGQVDSMNNLAMMYSRAGNTDDAMALLQSAVAINGQNADCQYNLGSIYLEKNQLGDALQAFQTADRLQPNDGRILNDLALTYEGLGMAQEARDTWQKVLQHSNNPTLLQQAKIHLDTLTQG